MEGAHSLQHTFLEKMSKIFEDCSPQQLHLARQLASAMLGDDWGYPNDGPKHPYARQIWFACGHLQSLLVPSLDPLHIEAELSVYRGGICLSCLSKQLADLTEGRITWTVPKLALAEPEETVRAERRRFELVREFTEQLAQAPASVRTCFARLRPEILYVLEEESVEIWLDYYSPLVHIVLYLAELAKEEADELGYDRHDSRARERSLKALRRLYP